MMELGKLGGESRKKEENRRIQRDRGFVSRRGLLDHYVIFDLIRGRTA